jgi:hypothetical protein
MIMWEFHLAIEKQINSQMKYAVTLKFRSEGIDRRSGTVKGCSGGTMYTI